MPSAISNTDPRNPYAEYVYGINPMLCHGLQPYFNLITWHLNFQGSEPPHKPQGIGLAPGKSINGLGLGNGLVLPWDSETSMAVTLHRMVIF